ncbi:uncharacterized protein N7477_010030 [Penicillium maclennaniae]|uniref:uncharacterized protein n=1 Tax=Penicillium maclennaniae TaxID=1343394 RepID=UPI00253F8106|nr:uncharacterized protein N7477_010030 [Penicillium maclennaniae]KAJ5662414.1 hypothetical protein N7477_010030 [Penicillium maclennaniae]
MARINTSNPLVRASARPKPTPSEKLERPVPSLTDSLESGRAGSNSSLSRGSSQRKKPGSSVMFDIFPDPAIESGSSAFNTPRKQTQRRTLKTSQVNSLLLPIQRPRPRPSIKVETDDYDKENDNAEDNFIEALATPMEPGSQRSPARRNQNLPRSPGRSQPGHTPVREMHSSETEEEDDCGNNSFDSLEDFIVSDNEDISYHETSHSETESEKAPTPPPPKSTRKRLLRGIKPKTGTLKKDLEENSRGAPFLLETRISDAIKSRSTPKEAPRHLLQDDFQLSSKLNELHLDTENEPAQLGADTSPSIVGLKFPTPAFIPATKSLETPPSSPSRNRLRSPTKEKMRIPPTPHRESVDAFWSQTETNHWIDQHSPRKEKTPAQSVIDLLKDFDVSDEEDSSPISGISLGSDSVSRASVTPPKTPPTSKTPSKTAIKKAEADAKRAAKARRESFNKKKANFAETFLEILDNAVSGGKVNLLAKPTGGVKITWSKTLQKTAGRAQWRSELVETRDPDGQRTGASQHIHHATIELAERIIDDEYRLINTLAHEYCHLANFMVSRVTDNPHGNSFKNWGKLCAERLKDHPIYGGQIHVTTKHSYQIDWKYVWACTGCGVTYGRHSKSIDPERQRCGTCRHRLEQIKPKPRMSPQKKAMAQVTKSLAQVQIEM